MRREARALIASADIAPGRSATPALNAAGIGVLMASAEVAREEVRQMLDGAERARLGVAARQLHE